MLLLVGLGNPGAKYQGNRHNIGFMAVEAMARAYKFGPWKKKFRSEVAEGSIAGVRCLAMKPQTFYNDSGHAVAEASRFYKVPTHDVIVFYDEIDLAPGRFRMKQGGGAAGNNGIRSISAWLDDDNFRRARLGTGHPGDKDKVHSHVLSDFAKGDAAWVEKLIDAVAKSAPLLVAGDDEKFQGEVMRLAPAEKAGGRGPKAQTEN
ncbi:aminoacyl-tRNA hydrolase [Terricaulis sp.]|uniref:aminoacyl-tRNA hydrolase n=1 Tax=Terricaulis sp. TaxID=2768686 RepID=UPI0037833E20